MHTMDVLECNVHQLHQFNWSSGHAKSREGRLIISSMNLNYSGIGRKKLRDSILTDDDVSEGKAEIFEIVEKKGKNKGKVKWSLTNLLVFKALPSQDMIVEYIQVLFT